MRSVAVVGTGLIGTSIALALREKGLTIYLIDRSAPVARTAAAMGAGIAGHPPGPVDLAVIAVPPAQVATVLAEQQQLVLARSYTDVASVKARTRREVESAGCDLASYVGGHPMAGSDRSGPAAAYADLFLGRSWALTPSRHTDRAAMGLALELVELCGAQAVLMDEGAHDRAVALTSHTPHLVASLLSAQLALIDGPQSQLVGQGLRDTTRVAGGDPALWADIIGSNSPAVLEVLTGFAEDLGTALDALRDLGEEGEQGSGQRAQGEQALGELLDSGALGQTRLPDQGEGPRRSPARLSAA